ncbi:MAG TPA: CHASE2 domain-containing protein, partial [Nitrospirae bacterium]|nr:CHASE2 domain-containing protein [Nitrospirota bacterium]
RYIDAFLNASFADTHKTLLSILSETEKRIDFDRLFVENISDTKNLIMPIDFTEDKRYQENISEMPDYLQKNSLAFKCKDLNIFEANNLISPIPAFAQKSFALGHIYLGNIDNSILRQQDLFICYKDKVFPSLSMQSFIKYNNLSLEDVFNQFYNKSIFDLLQANTTGRVYPNFNVISNLKYFSFGDLLSGNIDSSKIKDKIVIVGLNSPRLSEQIKVSQGREVSRMFIHGVIIQNLIDNVYLQRPSNFIFFEIAFLLMIIVIIFLGIFKWGKLKILPFILIIFWIVLSTYLFYYKNYLLQITYPIILSFLMFTIFKLRKRVYEKDDIQKMAKDIFTTNNLKVIIGAKSDIGRIRAKNEDSYSIDKSFGILAVADGVGGNVGGEIASRMAIDKMRSYIKDNYSKFSSDYSQLMKNAIIFANNYVYGFAMSNSELKGMATTLTAGFIVGSRLIIGHIGDSRAYLYRNELLEQLTEDHTVAVEKSIRNLSTDDFEKMRHVLTRAIGIGESLDVDTFELNLVKGDILLLCSDGLYTMIKEDDIISTLKVYEDPEMVCGALVNFANKNGGKDNITVITAFIQSIH